jgi:hypothetical protein
MLYWELARLTHASIAIFRQNCIRELVRHKLVTGPISALDGSGLDMRHRLVRLVYVSGVQVWWVSWRVLSGSTPEKDKEACVTCALVDDEVLEPRLQTDIFTYPG